MDQAEVARLAEMLANAGAQGAGDARALDLPGAFPGTVIRKDALLLGLERVT
jgi:hypothetical protein